MWKVFFILFLLPVFAISQEVKNDSVIHLSEFEVTSSRLSKLTTGLMITDIDSLSLDINRGRSLSTLLSDETPVYIKSYGPGNLSTVSIRGTSSSQTGIYWNGIKLNPPNNGMEDLSLYPVSLFDGISVLKGGASSLFGSGNIGGAIYLQNKPEFTNRIDVRLGGSAGSFNDYRSSGGLLYSNNKIWSKTSFAYKKSKNDFPYKNPDGETVRRVNAAQLQYGIMQDFARKINNNNIVSASLWFQSSGREIPGSINVPQGDAKQDDRSFRSVVNWKKLWSSGVLNVKGAYLYSYLHYLDPNSVDETELDNTIVTNTATGEINFQQRFAAGIFLAGGINYRFDNCSTKAYENTPERNTTGLFASANYRIPFIEWDVTANLRQDFINGYGGPFVPSFGAEGKIFSFVYGKINISRNFRVPTFNDLYWYPYGNPDLKPEKSWNEEASLIFKKTGKQTFELSLTGFNSVIDDYILWIPVSGSFWSAQNIQQVHARGLEANGLTKIKLQKLFVNVRLGYTYTKSTNQKQTGPNDNSIGKQLIYVPVNNFTGNLSFVFKDFILNYRHSYTGLRYTTRDNENYLPAYNIGDVMLSKLCRFNEFGVKIQFDVLNLYNTDYQPVAYYPMPGRNYRLSLYFSFLN